jgi:integrase/recombinase XerD
VVWSPQVRRIARDSGGAEVYVVGHRLVDEFLTFASSRARPNTVRAYAHDLKVFFTVVAKDPQDVRAADVFGFINAQGRAPVGAEKVVWISDGGSGLSNATIRRRLAAGVFWEGMMRLFREGSPENLDQLSLDIAREIEAAWVKLEAPD